MGTHATFAVGIDLDRKALEATLDDPELTELSLELLLPRRTFKAAAKVIARRTRLGLRRLRIVHVDYDPAADVGPPMLSAKAAAPLWLALPALEELELVGHALAQTLEHPGLVALDLTGQCFGKSGSFLKKPALCPALERLRWRIDPGDFNEKPGVGAFKTLWSAEGLGSLRELDLSQARLDSDPMRSRAFLKSPLLAQLSTLSLPAGLDAKTFEKALSSSMAHLDAITVHDDALAALDPRVAARQPTPHDVSSPRFVSRRGVEDAELAGFDFAQASALRAMELRWHWLGADGMSTVGRAMMAHPELERLDLGDVAAVGLRADAIEAFDAALAEPHPGLRSLDLSHNRLTGGGEALARVLGKLPGLEVLDLRRAGLTHDDVAALVPALSAHPALRVLRAAAQPAEHVGAPEWARLRLETLEEWSVDAADAAPFAGLGARLPRLRRLDPGRGLTGHTLAALADALEGHAALRALSVDVVDTDASYAALGELLGALELERLSLSESRSPDGSAPSSPEALREVARATSLRALRVTHLYGDDEAKSDVLVDVITALPNLARVHALGPLDPDGAPEHAGRLASCSVRAWGGVRALLAERLLARGVVEELTLDDGAGINHALGAIEGAAVATETIHTLRLDRGFADAESAKRLMSLRTRCGSLRRVELHMRDVSALMKFIEAFKMDATLEVHASTIQPMSDALAAALTVWSGARRGPTFHPLAR
jgi:hypothetical protein